MADKTITYLDIRQRIACSACDGTGEVVTTDGDDQTLTDDQLFLYICPVCKGEKFKMKKKSISLESFKGLKN